MIHTFYLLFAAVCEDARIAAFWHWSTVPVASYPTPLLLKRYADDKLWPLERVWSFVRCAYGVIVPNRLKQIGGEAISIGINGHVKARPNREWREG